MAGGCISLGAGIVGRNNFTAVVDPGVSSDLTQDYAPGSVWLNNANSRAWTCLSNSTGAASWYLSGVVPGVGTDPASMLTAFGSGAATFTEEGNLYRQVSGVAGAVTPGATGADNVIGVYALPALSLDQAGRGLTITAAGKFGATANNKTVRLWWNPSTAVLGSTVGAGGSLLADTGVVATNGGGWEVSGNVFKRGAQGSNTQTTTSNGAVAGGIHVGVVPPLDAVAVESGSILIAVTANCATVVTDAALVWAEVNAMN